MLPTGSCTVAVWPAATPLKFGVVTRFRMSRLPRKAELRRGEQAIRAAERVQNEAGDDHPDDHGDGRHGDLFDVHGKGAPSWLPAMHQPGDCGVSRRRDEATLRAIAASAQCENRFPR